MQIRRGVGLSFLKRSLLIFVNSVDADHRK